MLTTGLTIKEMGYVPLIILSPLLFLFALLIKLDSPGPVIYRRRVMGLNGRQFDAFKFRSMCIDGDEILKANQACGRFQAARTYRMRNAAAWI